MFERPKNIPHYEDLTQCQKAVVFTEMIHETVGNILRLTGKTGAPLRFAHQTGGRIAFVYLLYHSELLDSTYNRSFIEELEQLKREGVLPEEPRSLYMASNNDTCVQKVFPQTVHLDIRKPWPMPPNYNFIQADAKAMPLDSSSFDLAILKHYPMELRDALPELARVLKPDGVLIDHQHHPQPDPSLQLPTDSESAWPQADRLRTIRDFYVHGFDFRGRLKNGSEMYRKTEIDPERKAQIEEVLEHCEQMHKEKLRKQYYDALAKGNYAGLGLLRDFNLSLADLVLMEREEMEKQLTPLSADIQPEILLMIWAVLNKARTDKALIRMAKRDAQWREMKIHHPNLHKIKSLIHSILHA